MSQFNRFKHEKIQDGVDADQLLSNPSFSKAVENVLNKYAALEENVLTDDQNEIREITAKIKHYAMMRRATLDIVDELKILSRQGSNTRYENN